MDEYEMLATIGQGAYAKVYKARVKSTGQIVAVKKTTHRQPSPGGNSTHINGGLLKATLRETSILEAIPHSIYVVHLMRVVKTHSTTYLVFEYLDRDLKRFMRQRDCPLFDEQVRIFLYQLLKGVAHCHNQYIAHRDLKPHNLLLDEKWGLLKIADFGLGRQIFDPMGRVYTHEVVSLAYRPPEILLGEVHYGIEVDMWSVGCIFAEMSTGEILFRGESEFQQLLKIFTALGTPTEENWPGVTSMPEWHIYPNWTGPRDLARLVPSLEPEGVDLLSKMLVYNPEIRVSAEAALEHPYFDCLDKSQF